MLTRCPPSDGPVKTRVFRPARADVRPAVKPATPPPAITTSYSWLDDTRIILRRCELLRRLQVLPDGPAAEHIVQRGPDVDDTDDDQGIAQRVLLERGGEAIADEPGYRRPEAVADERLDEQQ